MDDIAPAFSSGDIVMINKMQCLKFMLAVGFGFSGALLLIPAAYAEGKAEPHPFTFPEYEETEYEQSIITIPIYAGTGPTEGVDPVEILKLTAFMKLERELPTRNGLGHRQIEFTIADWELYGYSEYLDADITFTLSDVPVQPKSLIVSLTEDSDYPAMIVYNAIYDIYIDQKLVAVNRPGVAFAKNVYEIPPRNISVAFSKPFTYQAERNGIEGMMTQSLSSIEEFTFEDGTCEDMFQITLEEYNQGVAVSSAIRLGEFTLQQ